VSPVIASTTTEPQLVEITQLFSGRTLKDQIDEISEGLIKIFTAP
jgi:hypothetical protein